MTTKLEAINEMLSCIGQSPISTISGNKTYHIATAESILNNESARIQASGYEFNTEEDYPFSQDTQGNIYLPINTLKVLLGDPALIQRGSRLYDKINHTYVIKKNITGTLISELPFEELPVSAAKYITMSAANKFVKRVLSSRDAYAYTQEDLNEALTLMQQTELETGDYNILNTYHIRKSL